MKSIAFAAQAIQCGDAEVVVAGGMENMSLIPHYLQGRKGQKFGNINIEDGLLKDGLVNVYDGRHMGTCGDACAEKYDFSREDQDAFTIETVNPAASTSCTTASASSTPTPWRSWAAWSPTAASTTASM